MFPLSLFLTRKSFHRIHENGFDSSELTVTNLSINPTPHQSTQLDSTTLLDTHNFSKLYATTGDVFDEVDSGDNQRQQAASAAAAAAAESRQLANGAGATRSTSVSGSHQLATTADDRQQVNNRCATLPHNHIHHQQQQQHHHLSSASSMLGVSNYEYFAKRASSQYLSNQQHYADMDPSSSMSAVAVAAAAAAAAAARQLQHSQQHLSTSNGNIPHSLV